jgi:hypothetical protein
MKAARRSHSSAAGGGVTSDPKGAPGSTMLRYCGLIKARAPSRAGSAGEGDTADLFPLALSTTILMKLRHTRFCD